MPLFLMISRHAPENCPICNAQTRKVYMDMFNKMEGTLKKHGVKLIWGGSVYTEHLSVYIFDAPSLEAFQKASMEPEVLAISAYETSEVKLAMGMTEAVKMLCK
jgi:hypothetical protein